MSGAPLALFYLTDWLNENGVRPVVAAPAPGPISDLLTARGVETIIDETFLTDPTRKNLDALCARFTLVIANTLPSWPLIRSARRLDRCAIWYLHETLVAFELAKKIPEIFPTFDEADLLVTPTQTTANLYRGITRAPIAVVPYGIPDAKTAAIEAAEARIK